jgi:hypothetical protein
MQQRLRMSRLLISSAAVALMALFAFSTSAYALTISPARVELSGNPGATVGGSFTLVNEQSVPETFYASYENFTAQGDTGSPSFSSQQSDLDTWMTVAEPQLTIAPGQTVSVPYTIVIPKSAEPGGYFSVIFLSTTPPTTNGVQVSIGAKIGLLVLLTVNGDAHESAGITQFDRNGHGFFYKTLPVILRYRFHNAGADRVQPSGTITIRDTVFLPTAHINANDTVGNILPNSTRQFIVNWVKEVVAIPPQGFFENVQYEWQNFAIGLYSAHIDVLYGTKSLHATNTTWFFVVPWELLVCIIVGVLIIFYGGKFLLVRYNRYIILKAQAASRQQSNVDLP